MEFTFNLKDATAFIPKALYRNKAGRLMSTDTLKSIFIKDSLPSSVLNSESYSYVIDDNASRVAQNTLTKFQGMLKSELADSHSNLALTINRRCSNKIKTMTEQVDITFLDIHQIQSLTQQINDCINETINSDSILSKINKLKQLQAINTK